MSYILHSPMNSRLASKDMCSPVVAIHGTPEMTNLDFFHNSELKTKPNQAK